MPRSIISSDCKRKIGSHKYLIEQNLIPLLKRTKGTPTYFAKVLKSYFSSKRTPTYFAKVLTLELGFKVTRQDVWRILNENGMTKKKASIVPGLSIQHEREAYIRDLCSLWTNVDQLVFIDEKKFKNQEVLKRAGEYGYSKRGTRLQKHLARSISHSPIIAPTIEVIGALSWRVKPTVTLTGEKGHVGLISFRFEDKKLNFQQILYWLANQLSPLLQPYPMARSILLFDNMPQHRSHQELILQIVNSRGAFVIWNPPNSPDLNPIEKLWDVCLQHQKNCLYDCLLEKRSFTLGDFVSCLKNASMTSKAYRNMLEAL